MRLQGENIYVRHSNLMLEVCIMQPVNLPLLKRWGWHMQAAA